MELTPRDLGTERYLALMRRRLTPMTNAQNGVTAANIEIVDDSTGKSRRGNRGRRLRRYWVQDLQLDEATADRLGMALWFGVPGVGARIGGIILTTYLLIPTIITMAAGAPWIVPFLLLMMWALLTGAAVSSPRFTVRKIHRKKLVATEVESLLPVARGRLERTYLNLVIDTLRQEIPFESTQTDIRAAIRDLGEAISRLPAEAPPSVDPELLRRESEERRLQARTETDSLVQASLLRQAEAFDSRASLGAQNASSARRITVLRREARVQMDSLRSILTAFAQTSHTDAVGIAHLSEAVQRVAQEAQAVTYARRELEEDELTTLLGHPLPADLPVQPTLPARKVVTPAPSPHVPVAGEAPVQILQPGRPWWRGQ
jgi:hypothetical protein